MTELIHYNFEVSSEKSAASSYVDAHATQPNSPYETTQSTATML
jgi:hypothetical protein